MTLDQARSFFLYCSLINYAFLLIWVMVATVGRTGFHRLSGRVFRVSIEQFDLLNLCGITLYKSAIWLFNIVPCIALYMIH